MARPRKTVVAPVKRTEPVKDEQLTEILTIPDANERSEELSKYDLTEPQKDAAQDAAKEDFLGQQGLFPEDEKVETKPLNSRAQKLVDELEGKGIPAIYPSNFSKWDESVYERLEKLNK